MRREMLCTASESERSELRQQLDDLLFNEEQPYDRVSDAHVDQYLVFLLQSCYNL